MFTIAHCVARAAHTDTLLWCREQQLGETLATSALVKGPACAWLILGLN